MTKNKLTQQTEALNSDFSALPDDLSTLLQIDLLMGRKHDFNRRLTHALNDLAKIADDAETSLKH